MKRSRKTRPLGQVLSELSGARKWNDKFAAYRIFKIWDEVVGGEMEDVIRPLEIRGGTLMVAVVDQVWLNQLSFLKVELLARINAASGSHGFSELRFVVDSDFFLSTEPDTLPSAEYVLPIPDKKDLERVDNLLSSIDDERVREVIRKVWLRINR